MPFELITVACFGLRDRRLLASLRWPEAGPGDAAGFDVRCHEDDHDLQRVLREVRPHVLLSFGERLSFPALWALPLDQRRRWLHFEDEAAVSGADLARHVTTTFLLNALTERFPAAPLISVFTAACSPGARIERPFRSLLAQGYGNWEWVLYDDSRDGGETFAALCALAARDARITVYRADRPSGVIGEVKRRAALLGRGELLVELDHDDELTASALGDVVAAFAAYPDAGFAYSDFAEVFADGRDAVYPPGWAFGYGSYRRESHAGREYQVANAPDINAKTIRHIVSAPNHLRAWRRSAYLAAGGHATDVHVADDYELCLRTFLTTRMVHLRRFGYVQWHDPAGGNTQRARNAEIQRLVRLFRGHYHHAVHRRLLELGLDDFLWRDGELDWDASEPPRSPVANYVFP